MIKKKITFLILNLSTLVIGAFFREKGMPSYWYQDLNQAPWTPPIWVFDSIWTIIIISYAVYLAHLIKATNTSIKIIFIFGISCLLNVVWNPIVFHFKLPFLELVIISLLALLISYSLLNFAMTIKLKSLLIAPYFLWIFVVISLNAYIVMFN